jgi:hypothetical protein
MRKRKPREDLLILNIYSNTKKKTERFKIMNKTDLKHIKQIFSLQGNEYI